MNLELKKFDINEIKDDKVVVLIGKRDTGKSFLCRDILYHHMNIPVGQVISGTEGANQFYSKIIPKLFIHLLDFQFKSLTKNSVVLSTSKFFTSKLDQKSTNPNFSLEKIFLSNAKLGKTYSYL